MWDVQSGQVGLFLDFQAVGGRVTKIGILRRNCSSKLWMSATQGEIVRRDRVIFFIIVTESHTLLWTIALARGGRVDTVIGFGYVPF
jgi:hypothetical protein